MSKKEDSYNPFKESIDPRFCGIFGNNSNDAGDNRSSGIVNA